MGLRKKDKQTDKDAVCTPTDEARVAARKALTKLFSVVNAEVNETRGVCELDESQCDIVRAVLAKHLTAANSELETHFTQWLAERAANRARFVRGEAVVIVDYAFTPQKASEWHKKDGVYRLKLWQQHEQKSSWYNSSTLRAVRSEDGKIVSWPAGTVGFVDLDYSVKRFQYDLKNIRVKFDGYVGWTDYRNLAVYNHDEQSQPDDDSDS